METRPLFSYYPSGLICFLASIILARTAAAQITVTTLADENDSPAGAQISLREAIRDSATGGQITLDPALAGKAVVLNAGELTVTGKTVNITAVGGLTIDARLRSRIFNVGAGAGLSLSGITLQNGRTVSGGGGAILSSGTLALTDCVLRDNGAAGGKDGAPGATGVPEQNIGGNGGDGGTGSPGNSGGAIHHTGSLSALRCHFINNFAGSGGNGGKGGDGSLGYSFVKPGVPGNGGPGGSGGAILNSGPLHLTGCVFTGNASGMGGSGGLVGIPNDRSCGSDGGNSGDGGAVRLFGDLSLESCTFYGNSAPPGGREFYNHGFGTIGCYNDGHGGLSGSGAAIACDAGTAVLKNSTFFNNSVGNSGGAAAPGAAILGGPQLRLVHCTITGNSTIFATPSNPNAPWTAPQTSGVAGSPRCENCIVSGNTVRTASTTQEINFSPGGESVLIPPNSPGTSGGVNLLLSPLSLTSGPLPVVVPGSASPVRHAGAALVEPLAVDQRGFPRPVAAPDLGAVEVQDSEPALRTPQSITFLPPNIAPSSVVTLTATASSALPVSLELLAGPAILNGNTLTFTSSPGFAVVRASQSGNAATAPALPLVRVIEAPPTHTISFTPSENYNVYSGSVTSVPLPLTTSAGLPVTWTMVDPPSPGLSLSGNVVIATAAGTIQVRGQFPGNAQHSDLNLTWSLTFVDAAVSWSYPQGSLPLFTFVEGSPYGLIIKARVPAPHSLPLPLPGLPGGLVPSCSFLPAGQTSVDCLVTLPATLS